MCLVTTGLLAQDPTFIHHTSRDQYLFPEEASASYALRDGVPMHSAPAMNSPVVHTLHTGERIMLLETQMDTLELNGIRSYWYRAKAGAQEGWTWGGNIAQRTFGSTADPLVKFVAGIDHVTMTDTGRIDFSYRITAISKEKALDHIVVRSPAWDFGQVMNNGNRGLQNVDDVITLEVPCTGGCGCTTGEVVLFWSGGKFHHVADLLGSPDGEYSSGTTFLYPADMEGAPETVIKVTSTYEEPQEEDLDLGNTTELTRIVISEYLVWNGQALVKDARPTEELRYQLPLDED
jgi:hypothetical protein